MAEFGAALGTPFYGTGDSFARLSNSQANQSVGVGLEGARLSDPFAPERSEYQNQLRKVMSDPGSMTTSPYYTFALNQGLNALQRKGTVRSGNKLAELVKYGEGVASQGYFDQARLLATLAGATTGSPAAAGAAYTGAYNRSQDQRQQAASQRAYGNGGGAPGSYADPFDDPYYRAGTTVLPSGYDSAGVWRGGSSRGGGVDYGGAYDPSLPSGGYYSGGYDPYGYDSYGGGYADYGYGGYDSYGGDYGYDGGGYDYGGEY